MSLLLLVVGCSTSKKEYNIKNLKIYNNTYTENFNDEILSGIVFKMYGGKKIILGKLKNGKKEGSWVEWYINGQKKNEGIYRNGKKDGLWTFWGEIPFEPVGTISLNEIRFQPVLPDDYIKTVGRFVKGMKVEKWISYHEDGTVKEVKDCDTEDCK